MNIIKNLQRDYQEELKHFLEYAAHIPKKNIGCLSDIIGKFLCVVPVYDKEALMLARILQLSAFVTKGFQQMRDQNISKHHPQYQYHYNIVSSIHDALIEWASNPTIENMKPIIETLKELGFLTDEIFEINFN